MPILKKKKCIMGIDPGTNVLGYAFLDVIDKKPILRNLGVIKLDKYPSHYEKLRVISDRVDNLIRLNNPDQMAIEAPFYGKNAQSMLKLGRAQGVAISVGMIRNLTVVEYSPKKIKNSITGNGNASKEQVAAMLKQILKMETLPKYYDATDALGAAVCHYLQGDKPVSSGNNYKNWGDFIKNNPKKVK